MTRVERSNGTKVYTTSATRAGRLFLDNGRGRDRSGSRQEFRRERYLDNDAGGEVQGNESLHDFRYARDSNVCTRATKVDTTFATRRCCR
jgi:hypothetical protein